MSPGLLMRAYIRSVELRKGRAHDWVRGHLVTDGSDYEKRKAEQAAKFRDRAEFQYRQMARWMEKAWDVRLEEGHELMDYTDEKNPRRTGLRMRRLRWRRGMVIFYMKGKTLVSCYLDERWLKDRSMLQKVFRECAWKLLEVYHASSAKEKKPWRK